MNVSLYLAVAFNVLLFVSGCAFRSEEATPAPAPTRNVRPNTSSSPSSSNVLRSPSAPSGPTKSPEASSPFRMLSRPPAGIVGEIFQTALGPPCFADRERYGPGQVIPSFTLEILDLRVLCLDGFDPTKAEVTTAPSDLALNPSISYAGDAIVLSIFVDIDAPIDTYIVTIAQEGLDSASGEFEVRKPSTPRLVSLIKEGPAGTTFKIGVIGLTEETPVHLYGKSQQDQAWHYRTALAPVYPDSEGRAVMDLSSVPGDPSGTYVITNGRVQSCLPEGSTSCAVFVISER